MSPDNKCGCCDAMDDMNTDNWCFSNYDKVCTVLWPGGRPRTPCLEGTAAVSCCAASWAPRLAGPSPLLLSLPLLSPPQPASVLRQPTRSTSAPPKPFVLAHLQCVAILPSSNCR